VLYQIVGGVITFCRCARRNHAEQCDAVRWATFLGQLLFILVPTVWLARERHGDLPEFFRLRVPEVRHLAATMVAVFALQQMLAGVHVVQDMIPFPEGPPADA